MSNKKPIADIVADLKGLPIDEFFDKLYMQLSLRYPQDITELGIADEAGIRNDQLDNMSDAYLKRPKPWKLHSLLY